MSEFGCWRCGGPVHEERCVNECAVAKAAPAEATAEKPIRKAWRLLDEAERADRTPGEVVEKLLQRISDLEASLQRVTEERDEAIKWRDEWKAMHKQEQEEANAIQAECEQAEARAKELEAELARLRPLEYVTPPL